jgi:hypothetical protein
MDPRISHRGYASNLLIIYKTVKLRPLEPFDPRLTSPDCPPSWRSRRAAVG